MGQRNYAFAALVVIALLSPLTAKAQQAQTPPQPPQAQQNPPVSAASHRSGLLESIGNWFQGTFDRFRSGVERAGGVAKDAAGAATGAADAAKGVAREAADTAKGAAKRATTAATGVAEQAADTAKGVARGAADAATGAAKQATTAAASVAEQAADTVKRLPTARMAEGHELCAIASNGAPDCRVAAVAICKRHGFASGTSVDIQSAQKCPALVWLSGRTPEPGECEVQSFVNRALCQ
jgi:hypothetical protein